MENYIDGKLDHQQPHSDLLMLLEDELSPTSEAGNYKAQADFWMEKYQTLRQECLRATKKRDGLKRLSEMLDEDLLECT